MKIGFYKGQKVPAVQSATQTALIGKGLGKLKDIIELTALGTWFMAFAMDLGKKILGVIGVGTAVSSGVLNVAQVMKLLEGIGDPQAYLLDYMASALSHLPFTISNLFATIDNTLSSATSGYFTPPITLTYLVQVTAVGECFNQLLMSAIQNAVFVFSIYLIRWAFTNNTSYVHTGNQKPK